MRSRIRSSEGRTSCSIDDGQKCAQRAVPCPRVAPQGADGTFWIPPLNDSGDPEKHFEGILHSVATREQACSVWGRRRLACGVAIAIHSRTRAKVSIVSLKLRHLAPRFFAKNSSTIRTPMLYPLQHSHRKRSGRIGSGNCKQCPPASLACVLSGKCMKKRHVHLFELHVDLLWVFVVANDLQWVFEAAKPR
jgi:hypothetical protein